MKETSLIQTDDLVIKDMLEIKTYSLEEVLNKVILGDALKVLRRIMINFVINLVIE